MQVRVTWDPHKAHCNLLKHGVSFAEAATVLGDDLGATRPDPDHSLLEDRLICIGQSNRRRILVVVYVERGDTLRIIHARVATATERRSYEEG